MSWTEDGIERKIGWFEKLCLNKTIKKKEKERFDKERKQVFSKAFESFTKQIFFNE